MLAVSLKINLFHDNPNISERSSGFPEELAVINVAHKFKASFNEIPCCIERAPKKPVKIERKLSSCTPNLVKGVMLEVSQKVRVLACIHNSVGYCYFFSHSFCSMVQANFFCGSLPFHTLAWHNSLSFHCGFQSNLLCSGQAEKPIQDNFENSCFRKSFCVFTCFSSFRSKCRQISSDPSKTSGRSSALLLSVYRCSHWFH